MDACREEYSRSQVIEQLKDFTQLREAMGEADDLVLARLSQLLVDAYNMPAAKRQQSMLMTFIGSALCAQIIDYLEDYVERDVMPDYDADAAGRVAVEKDARDAERREGVA